MSDFSSGSVALSSNRPPLNQATVFEADPAAGGHHLEQVARQLDETLRSRSRMAQHPREHVVRKQADVGEHAEDETVDEVRDRLRFVTALAQLFERAGRAAGGGPGSQEGRMIWSALIRTIVPPDAMVNHVLRVVEALLDIRKLRGSQSVENERKT